MAELVRQMVKQSFIDRVKKVDFGSEDSFPSPRDLLPPPRIEVIELSLYDGQIGDSIFFATSDDFGIWNIYMVIRDGKENLIESGDASQFDDCSDYWDYLATVAVLSGTSVHAYAIATDSLGGAGTLSASKTAP